MPEDQHPTHKEVKKSYERASANIAQGFKEATKKHFEKHPMAGHPNPPAARKARDNKVHKDAGHHL